MLKRYQVLITNWLGDYIKLLSEKHDASFSETIRLSLCMQYAQTISMRYPEFKTKLNQRKVLNRIEKLMKSKKFAEESHKIRSEVYFEARKAIDYALEKGKKQKNNHRSKK